MTYPTDDLTTTHLDNSADDPSQARAELLAAIQKIQAMIAATGIGNNDALKLNSSGDIPSGVNVKSSIINGLKGSDIASATTTDIGAATGNYINITGAATITGLGTVQAGTKRTAQFSGAPILTYNATSLILPGNANITAAAGDVAEFVSLGSGNWICTKYQRDTNKPYGSKFATDANSPVVSSTLLDIDALTETTYVEVGETGSGATQIWTALDSIPDDVDWIEVKGNIFIANTSGTQVSCTVNARPDGSAATGVVNQIGYAAVNAAGNGANLISVGGLITGKINVSNKKFDIFWSRGGVSSTSQNVYMYLVGYGYN